MGYNPTALKQWIADWRALGVKVLGWGWLEADPWIDAELAVALCRQYELEGYIANAETSYEGPGRWKSKMFVERYRQLAPRAPLALSGLIAPHPWIRDFDYGPWIEAGASFRPQAYEGNPLYRLPIGGAYGYAVRAGWSDDRVQPDILGITAGANVQHDVLQLIGTDALGFGVFTAPPTDDDYRAIGKAIREHGIAERP